MTKRVWGVIGVFLCALGIGLECGHDLQAQAVLAGRSHPIPNSLTPAFLKTEAILNQPISESLASGFPVDSFIEEMSQIGIAAHVDATARDDAWPAGGRGENGRFGWAHPEMLLGEYLTLRLRDWNCHFRVNMAGTLVVFSIDNCNDHDQLMVISYDVSRIVNNIDQANALIETIQNNVMPDSWIDSGLGEGTIDGNIVNGRWIVTSNTSYFIHKSIARILNNLATLSAAPYTGRDIKSPSSAFAGVSPSGRRAVTAGSTSIAMPTKQTVKGMRGRRGIALPNSNTTSGFGGGGGGGVF